MPITLAALLRRLETCVAACAVVFALVAASSAWRSEVDRARRAELAEEAEFWRLQEEWEPPSAPRVLPQGENMATTTVHPNADGTRTNWTTDSGGTSNLYQTVDETLAAANDSDYIQSTSGGTPNLFLALGDMPGDFDTVTSVAIKIRARRDPLAAARELTTIRLVQSDESTVITANSTQILTTSWTDYTFNPSITGGTSKSVWDGARIRFAGDPECQISAVEVVVTYNALAAITGDFSKTEGADTLSGAATTRISGTTSKAEAADTLAATIGASLQADGGPIEAADTLSATVTAAIVANANITEAADGFAGHFNPPRELAFAKTEAADTLSASATLRTTDGGLLRQRLIVAKLI